MNKLQNVHIVDYDELIENPRTEINKIEEFLGLKLSFKEKIIDTSQKFTQVLSKEDITRINSILLNHFEEEYLKKTVI